MDCSAFCCSCYCAHRACGLFLTTGDGIRQNTQRVCVLVPRWCLVTISEANSSASLPFIPESCLPLARCAVTPAHRYCDRETPGIRVKLLIEAPALLIKYKTHAHRHAALVCGSARPRSPRVRSPWGCVDPGHLHLDSPSKDIHPGHAELEWVLLQGCGFFKQVNR